MSERAYKTDAFVLRGRNLGEADRIFTLFTRERGKLDAVAKGVRRIKSHNAGRLEFLTEAELTLHAGRSLDVITGATILHSEWEGLVEPRAFAAANVAAELVDAFCEPDLPQDEIYVLLQGVVHALATALQPADLLPRFELRLLDLLGLLPALDTCVHCGTDLREQEEAWLDPPSGGLVCGACHRGGEAGRLEGAQIENVRALAAAKRTGSATSTAAPAVARAVDALVTYHLGKRAKASAFLEELAHQR
ncbi:MAG: DNA repair protein RecO [Candidatus Eremiobacteraeota bacterium]|nr:DNA repair protein RecO [Candidatus Eremiobacteraeota bacterium]